MVTRLTDWLLVAVVSVLAPPQSCDRRTQPPGPPPIEVGQRISSTIASRDRQCPGIFAPCRVFQVTPVQAGLLRATLTWTNDQARLRLAVWNDHNGDGACCHSGEHVSVAVAQGDRVEIHIVLAESIAEHDREAFDLITAIHDVEE